MDGVRKIPLENFPPFKQTIPKLLDDAVNAVEIYRGLLLSRSWELLHAQVIPLSGFADVLLRSIQTRTELHEHWAEYLSERDSGLKNAFSDLKTDNSAQADTVRATMLSELTASLGNEADAQKFLDDLLAGDSPLFSSRASEKSALSSEQDIAASTQILLATVAHRASIESSTYASYNQVKNLGTGPEGGEDTNIISNEVATLADLHGAIIEELFEALTADTERQSFVNLCVGRQAQIAERLPASAMLVGGYLALLHQNAPSADLLKEYQATIELVEWIKRFSVIHSYLSFVRAEVATVDPGRWYSNEKRRTTSRQLASEVPVGQPMSVEDILGGSAAEGEFVQIEGLVDGLIIEDDPSPPKFSSFFNLVVMPSGTSIRVRAHMFSLANNGLEDGAFVRLNGFVRVDPSWNDTTGIDIDRVSLTELRKSSWYDDMTHRARSNVLLYQDGMNMFFTPAVGGTD